jgi:hypothetical protein
VSLLIVCGLIDLLILLLTLIAGVVVGSLLHRRLL